MHRIRTSHIDRAILSVETRILASTSSMVAVITNERIGRVAASMSAAEKFIR